MAVRTTFIILALLLSAASVAVSGQVLATGDFMTAVVRSDGTVWICGQNGQGSLGDGSNAAKGTFVEVMAGAQAVSLGSQHSAVLRSDGTVWTTGHNYYSGLGDGAGGVSRNTFKEVLTGGQAVSLGYHHTGVLRSDGTVWTAGRDQHGQLGDGGNSDRDTFVEVLAGAQAVCLGEFNTAALMSDGTLVMAGQDDKGQLGDGGGHADRNTFSEYFPGETVQAMGLQQHVTAVVKSDGTVWTTGWDGKGQLGDGGGNADRDTFMQVLDGAQSIGQGAGLLLAVVKSDGTLWTAGSDRNGELGDGGSNSDRDTFAQVLDGAQAAAAGFHHTAVIMSDGTVWTAGWDHQGSLGDGGSDTERGTFKKVIDGVFPPTAAPTPPPTPSPTTPPTTASTAGTNGGSTSAKGDPHLQNINGQRFDLTRPGRHALLHIPRGAEAPGVLLRVVADVLRLGAQCGETYFQHINVTGAWVKGGHDGILRFHADDVGGEEEAAWMSFGAVSLKVVHAQHRGGIRYLNIYAKHLGRVQFKIGGLLGEDDHEYEATPDEDCIPKISFFSRSPRGDPPSTPPPLSAEASLA